MKTPLNLKVDKEKCVKCGLCAKDCLVHAIQINEEGYPYSNATNCLGCQHCLAICPQGAISSFDLNPENSLTKANVASEEMFKLIANRRSCRQYKHENIDTEKMAKLKDMLNYVPTGCNFKDLHFSIIEDVNVMESVKDDLYTDLQKIVRFMPFGSGSKLKSYKNAIMKRNNDFVFRNAPHAIIVSVNKKAPCKDIDPTIALSYFELYAQTLGLGTLWCGLGYWTIPLSKKVMKRLEIPKTHKIAYVMLFGNPAIDYKRSIQPEKYEFTTVK